MQDPGRFFSSLDSWLLRLALLMVLSACGGDGVATPSDPSPAPPPTPARASFTATQTGVALIGLSPSPRHRFRVRIPTRIEESAGLGGNLDFARLRVFMDGAEIERAEMTASAIIASAGTNDVPAGGSLDVDIDFDVSADDFDDARIVLGLTDDRGTRHELDYVPDPNRVAAFPGVLELLGENARAYLSKS